MLAGHDYDAKEIAAIEREFLDKVYQDDNSKNYRSILEQGIDYYGLLFQTFLNSNPDKNFEALEDSDKDIIIDKELTRFESAMIYSFNKGHQMAFALLLTSKSERAYTADDFAKPDARDNFIYMLEEKMKKKIMDENLQRDANDLLIRYTRRNFENGYQNIMQFARVFFKKGFAVAFDQIRKDIMKVEYHITGKSRLLNAPYNQRFSVTPAFSAKFAIESPAFEEWDIYWDETYGFSVASQILAKVFVHEFTASEIRAYKDVDANMYMMLCEYMDISKFQENEKLYLVEFQFQIYQPIEDSRDIQASEYEEIRQALSATLCNRLNVKSSNILIVR